jgi:hypothetical protein
MLNHLLNGPILANVVLPVVLVWQAEQVPERNLTDFVHFIEPNGRLVAQQDVRP